jgi:pimeloyl-ACP methyl ester carboxylesterase
LGLEKLFLCGHSFGGYISGLFTIKYPEMVDKLILLSPVGVSPRYVEIESTKLEDFMQSFFFKVKKSPSFGYKSFGFVSNAVFNYVCEGKFKGLQKIKVK